MTTIYSNSDWNTAKVKSSEYMFNGNGKLVGNIAYDWNKRTVEYANPDTGYFTRKTA